MGQGGSSATVFEDSDSRSDSKESSRSGSFTIGSQFSSVQRSSAASDGGSRAIPRDSSFKRLVQDLVDKVVPEEAEHVDDMIEQFKGRKNELLETLRTLQERNIAQKARKAGQQRAKIEAKQMVKQARQEQTNADPGERVPVAPASMPALGAPTTPATPTALQTVPTPRAAAPITVIPSPMAQRTPAMDGVAPMTQDPTPFPTVVAPMPAPPANTEDAAAAAAADWAIAQALSNLQKEQSSLEDQSYVVPDEDFNDEGSL